MKQGSIVAINYTGKVVVSGQVFESTIEKKAVEAGIFNEKSKYEPMVIVVGEGDVLPGLDKALQEMKVGEQRSVKVLPAEGWGERKPENVRVVPLQQFREKKMNPFPGLAVEVNGQQGRIQSVSGGRVRIDFNHPLAGKQLEYEVKIERELTEPKQQIEALFQKYFYMVPEAEKKLAIGKEEVEVSLSPRWSANIGPLKQLFSKIVTKHVKGFEKVRFVEEFKEEKKAAAKEEKAPEKIEKPEEKPREKEEEKKGKTAEKAAEKKEEKPKAREKEKK